MIPRMINLSNSRSFFLFGPRGTGKSTLLNEWGIDKSVHFFDLLDPALEAQLNSNPQTLLEIWSANKTEWIVIDEIQKQPKLLDVVHKAIHSHKIKFALTGSSARKLRRGASNLLGGRASEFHLHPLTHIELNLNFELMNALQFGTLPEIISLDNLEKERALYGYVSTYLKEEVLVEQLIRKVEPFRSFLEIAAQMNGKILNFAKISRDSGVEEKSVARYYQILDDTLLGFFLEPFHSSIRKRQSQKSKFYFFDCGVTRALQNNLKLQLTPQTNSFGDLFEQFIILELLRINDYKESRYRFSYFLTKDGAEIDLVIERPGLPVALIEIKSSSEIKDEHSLHLRKLADSFKNYELFVLNNATQSLNRDNVKFRPWKIGLKEIFETS